MERKDCMDCCFEQKIIESNPVSVREEKFGKGFNLLRFVMDNIANCNESNAKCTVSRIDDFESPRQLPVAHSKVDLVKRFLKVARNYVIKFD